MEDKYETEPKCGSQELPKMTVAYIRLFGPYREDDKLFEGI